MDFEGGAIRGAFFDFMLVFVLLMILEENDKLELGRPSCPFFKEQA